MGCNRAFAIALSALWASVCAAAPAGMDGDLEARALLTSFRELKEAAVYLDDRLDGSTKGAPVVGPVGFGPGSGAAGNAGDKALQLPETREEAVYVYYGPYVPRCGRFSLDFRNDRVPAGYTMMTLFSVGTAGNTCMMLRLGLDRRVRASVVTRRETVELTSDPVGLRAWHRVQWSYGPRGSVLVVDGVIQDYATDWSVPYAHDISNALYLGDQPWWDGGKGVFYPGDSFVGLVDNLRLVRLEWRSGGVAE